MNKIRTLLSYLSVAFLYLAIIFAIWHPLVYNLNSFFLGSPGTDIFNEMWLDRAGIESLLAGHWSYSTNLSYPSGINFYLHFLSWLHIYFSAPIVYLFPWPLSWNLTVVFSMLCGAMSAFWAVRKISGHMLAAFASGFAMLIAPSTFYNVCEGYLPQIWIAPLIVANYWLYEIIYSPKSLKQVFWLFAWALISTLVYWINGLFLALSACIMIFCRLPRLSAKVFVYLIICAVITVVYLFPFARCVNNAQPMINEGVNRAISPQDRSNMMERSVNNSAGFAEGKYTKCYMNDCCNGIKVAVPYIFITFFVMLAAIEWKKRIRLVWLNCASCFFILSLGPYLLVEASSQMPAFKVSMPYMLLVDMFQPLYRWSMPLRTLPIAFFFAAAGLADLERYMRHVLGRRASSVVTCTIIILSVFLLGDFFHKESRKGNFLTPASIPSFCRVMKAMSQGVFVDAPIGFIGNVYQLQMHHHKPIIACSGAYKGNSFNLVENNSFLQYLFLWNNLAAVNHKLLPFTFLRASISEDYVYGQKLKVEDADRFEVWHPPYNCEFSKKAILSDYKKLYDMNIRYVVIHKANCFWIDNEHGEDVFRSLCGIAELHFGEPVYTDEDVEIFEMKADINLPDDILEKARECLK